MNSVKDKLIIVGNGFDLNLGLRSSYNYFRDELKREKNSLFDIIYDNLFEKDKNNPCLWSDFEQNISKIDHDRFVTFWENELSDAEDAAMYLTDIKDYLYTNFTKWIKRVNTSVSKIDRKIGFKNDCIFINFNYTTTLELCCCVPESDIYYIHGTIKNPSAIIMGHTRYMEISRKYAIPKDLAFMSTYYAHQKVLLEYYKSTDKNCLSNLKSLKNAFEGNFESLMREIKDIYILGHSLNEVDTMYFQYLVSILSNSTKWHLSYYSEQDKQRNTRFIYKNSICNYVEATIDELIDDLILK